MYFPATVLGHHALEMYLKAALIRSGMTACNPRKIKFLDSSIGITKQECAWGHDLIALAEELARIRPDFNTSTKWDKITDILRNVQIQFVPLWSISIYSIQNSGTHKD